MANLKWVKRITDYGAEQYLLKSGNKIVAWVESFPYYTAVDEEREKWFYAFGKPSDTVYISFKTETKEQAMDKVMSCVFLEENDNA